MVYAGLRWAFLFRLPVFVDEANGLNWTRDMLMGHPFEALPHARWLDTAVWALFRPLGPESLWLARAVAGLFALLAGASAIGVGRRLHSPAAGLLAGALMLVLPLAVFFDRQALAEPFLAAFGGVALVAALDLAHRPRLALAGVTGAALAAAMLAKFSGVWLAPAPLVAALVMARPGLRRRAIVWAIAATLFAAAVVLGVLAIADRSLEPHRSMLNPAYSWSWTHFTGGAGGFDLASWAQDRQQVARTLIDHLGFFFTWPAALAAALSLAFAVGGPHRRPVVWLWLAGIGPFGVLLLLTNWLPARYMMLFHAPLAVLAALTTVRLAELGPGRPPLAGAARSAGLALGVLMVAWPIPRTIRLLVAPANTPMPTLEYVPYFASEYSGLGLESVHAALAAYAADHPGPLHVIFAGTSRSFLASYWGGQAGTLWPYDGSHDQQVKVAGWLLAGESVAFLDTDQIPIDPYDAQTKALGEFRGALGQTYRLRVAIGPGPDLLRVMYGEASLHPEDYRQEYQALADQTPLDGRAWSVFPPHQLDVLRTVLGGQPVDLAPVGEQWPIDVEAAGDTLAEVARTHWMVSAIFLNEQGVDPERRVERWMANHLYRLGERWYGPLRVVDYVSPVGEDSLSPVQASFGGLMALDQAAVALTDTPAGSMLLVDLEWHAMARIERPYKVAVHVLSAEGQIVAQHDGVPGGWLAPTTLWTPGEVVTDRLAIALPGDLPPDCCQVQVAVYDEETLQRLPLDSGTGDSLLIGRLTR